MNNVGTLTSNPPREQHSAAPHNKRGLLNLFSRSIYILRSISKNAQIMIIGFVQVISTKDYINDQEREKKTSMVNIDYRNQSWCAKCQQPKIERKRCPDCNTLMRQKPRKRY